MNACQCASIRPASARPVRRDNPNLGIRIDRDCARGYALDDAVFDQYVGRSRERGSPTIEDANVLKERRTPAHWSSERLQTWCCQIRIALRRACVARSDHERRSQDERCTERELQYSDYHEADLHRELRGIKGSGLSVTAVQPRLGRPTYPSQGLRGVSELAGRPRARLVLCSVHPWPSSPTPS